MALKRYYSLENRLSKCSKLRNEYNSFMEEYERLGHMTFLSANLDELGDGSCGNAYSVSHHAVIGEDSLTTRLRVVFNGSGITDNNLSLNDTQVVGPTIHKYVLNADISKMYRQVLINKSDRKYQRIFWRSDPTDVLKCYELNVITYGLASSPFLAIRCLYQLTLEDTRSLASNEIQNCCYIDDMLTGSHSKEELLKIQNEVSEILSNSGFDLQKYLSNRSELLENFNVNRDLEASILVLGEAENNKTLGI